MKIKLDYKIYDDIQFIIESENINIYEFSNRVNVSRTTLGEIAKTGRARNDICEKIYAYAYKNNFRINLVKEELANELYHNILYHGSREGLDEITVDGSRDSCDFGKGFYLGESYQQALSFVCEKENSCVYSFRYSLENLKIKKFNCNLEWMFAIGHYRGSIKAFDNSELIKKIVSEIETADVIIAPIADNKMFYIMTRFAEGDINADVAIHSLSASRLGLQYIFRTNKAIEKLIPNEKYYISIPEREDCSKLLMERSYEIDTKLKLAKRKFKKGLYIEELLK